MDYVTLYQLRAELGIAVDRTGDDALLRRLIQDGVKWVEMYCRRRFDLRSETQRYDHPIRPRSQLGRYPMSMTAGLLVAEMNGINDASAGRLRLDDDLLELVGVVNGDGDEIDLADIWYEPANVTPYSSIRLKPGSGLEWQPDGNNRRQCIQITGLWGYHDDYANAMADTLDTVENDPLSISGTLITVNDADGPAEDSDEPRFQAGNLIGLASGSGFELMLVRSVNYTTQVVTVKRAVNGTTAQAWPKETPISVFRPMSTVRRGLTRLVTWLYRMKDVTFFERVTILGNTQKVAQGAVPPDVTDLLPTPKPARIR